MSIYASFLKRSFDIIFSLVGLFFFGWLIFLAALLATLDTGLNGFFMQTRVGKEGKRFKVIKIRTMRPVDDIVSTVTAEDDARITALGRILRKAKIDELPQLLNVFVGHMSFVGPRPDMPGFADKLEGDDKVILSIRPGITGPATLYYRDEEALLASVDNPEDYNRDVIFPEKIRMNRDYVNNYSFWLDIKYILQTIFGFLFREKA